MSLNPKQKGAIDSTLYEHSLQVLISQLMVELDNFVLDTKNRETKDYELDLLVKCLSTTMVNFVNTVISKLPSSELYQAYSFGDALLEPGSYIKMKKFISSLDVLASRLNKIKSKLNAEDVFFFFISNGPKEELFDYDREIEFFNQ
jgi:hypothetical protein